MRLFVTQAFAAFFLLIASLPATAQTIDPLWVQIYPGTSIQSRVNQFPGATTFYLRAGVHRRQTVVPKSSNRFIGEAGAVLDGENVTALAFSTITARSSGVTIKGLTIRNYASGSRREPYRAMVAPVGWSRTISSTGTRSLVFGAGLAGECGATRCIRME